MLGCRVTSPSGCTACTPVGEITTGPQAEEILGGTVEVLVAPGEGRKDAETHRMSGRADDNRLVHFALPADLPEFIAVDVSKLALGEVIHLADLSLPQGVTLIELKHDNNIGVVSCHLTKVGKLDEEEAEGDEAAEGDDK